MVSGKEEQETDWKGAKHCQFSSTEFVADSWKEVEQTYLPIGRNTNARLRTKWLCSTMFDTAVLDTRTAKPSPVTDLVGIPTRVHGEM
eukprot:1430629-Rhodomonas_salina.1